MDAEPYMDDEESSEPDEFAENMKEERAKAKRNAGLENHEGNVYDDYMGALFEIIPPGEGDEFSAVKPWLGAIKEPKNHHKPNKKAPKQDFKIDWVYGYRSEEVRQNCQFNHKGQAVYMTASIGVIYDYRERTQVYFGGGKTDFGGRKQQDESNECHSDDITALCLSKSRQMVATGQNGQKPLIYLWNSENAEVICQKRLPKGCRLVTAIAISASDKYIVAADAAEKICCHIFKIDGSKNPVADVQIGQKIVHVKFHPTEEGRFATAGKDHLALCDYDGGKKITKKMGTQPGKPTSQCCAAWVNDPKFGNDIITGGADGNLYHWQGGKVQGKGIANNKGPVQACACRPDEKLGEIVLVGGNDKTLTVYQFTGTLQKLWNVATPAAPRSLDLFQGQILIGMKNGSIAELEMTQQATGQIQVVMTSHCDGEVWGMTVIDFEDGRMRLLTSADDNRILAYDPLERRVLNEGKVAAEQKKEKKSKKKGKAGGFKGGASTQSSEPPEAQSRALAWCMANSQLAVACNNGVVTIRDVDWAAVDNGEPGALDKVKKTLFKTLKKAEWIEAMHYSPCGKYLAVGSHDNMIYVLDTKSYSEKKMRKLTGHSSFITSLDWSMDSKWIRSNCGAYELLFFNVTQPAKKERDPSGASNTIEVDWCDTTNKLGWNVQGIFPSGCDGSHINSVAQSTDTLLLASGDDYGLVCVYNNPLLEKHDSNKYRGHSEHVTGVKFSMDSKMLFSIGGQDQTCIQWKRTK